MKKFKSYQNKFCYDHYNISSIKIWIRDRNLHSVFRRNESVVGSADNNGGVGERESESGQDEDWDLIRPPAECQTHQTVSDAEALKKEEGKTDKGKVAEKCNGQNADGLVL